MSKKNEAIVLFYTTTKHKARLANCARGAGVTFNGYPDYRVETGL